MKTMTLDRACKTATLIDQGQARLLVATWDLDRGGDIIQRGAFKDTIRRWKASKNQRLPLLYDHSGDPADNLGWADANSLEETEEGLVVEAHLDLENSNRAREVWRSVKAGTLFVSFGYLAEEEIPQGNGTRLLKRIDVLEVTLTPSPMNPAATVLSWKSTEDAEQELSPEWDAILNRDYSTESKDIDTERKSTPITMACFDIEV